MNKQVYGQAKGKVLNPREKQKGDYGTGPYQANHKRTTRDGQQGALPSFGRGTHPQGLLPGKKVEDLEHDRKAI